MDKNFLKKLLDLYKIYLYYNYKIFIIAKKIFEFLKLYLVYIFI